VHTFVAQSYDVIVTERYDDDRYTAAEIYLRDTSLHVRYGRFVTHCYRVTTSGYDPLLMMYTFGPFYTYRLAKMILLDTFYFLISNHYNFCLHYVIKKQILSYFIMSGTPLDRASVTPWQ
jgi:hypothetical protein